MLPTHTAVEAFVEEATIQVWSELFVVPVLPKNAVPSFGLAVTPVPPRVMTPCKAFAAVFAMFGATA